MTTLSGREIAAAGLADWTLLNGALHTRLLSTDFGVGLRLVAEIGVAAERVNHHPDLDLRYAYVDVRLTSHDVRGVTARDLALAAVISEIAAAAGVLAAPESARLLEIALDTPDTEAVLPFWRAVLDMTGVPAPQAGPELRDDVLPTLWFQPSGSEPARQRFHLDVWVAPAVVEERIAAALAAGGSMVSAADAPAFWVLADRQGNRVCLCTWQNRDRTG